MTSPSSSAKMHKQWFVPKDCVTIQVGRLSASVYPKVESSMPVFEHAHAFQVTKSALESLAVDTRLILEAMGTQLNCSMTVDGLIHDWHGLFNSAWLKFNNLAIVLFHNLAGRGINNTIIAGNPALLLPVVNGLVGICRQQDVRLVHVGCKIDFTRLVMVHNYGPTTLCFGFYLKLPQTTFAMVNGNNQAFNLTTWHGTADLATLTSDEVHAQILEPTLQDGPITLRPTDFNLGDANINTTAIRETIHTKILKLGFKQICTSIFMQLRPGYSNQPHAMLEHIQQTSIGPNGQPVTATVMDYYQCMMNAVRPFATQQRYAISICNRFIWGLDKTLIPSFRHLYPNHSTVHNLDGTIQQCTLPIILEAAQAAEDERNQI
jgi:hypothetical protein